MGNRIKFVRVTLSALQRHPKYGFSKAIHAVEHFNHAKLLWNNRSFFVDHAIAQKSRGDDLFLSCIG